MLVTFFQRLRATLRPVAIYLTGFAWVSVALITLADVIGRASLNLPIYGSFELVKLMMALGLLFSMPLVSISNAQVTVELISQRYSKKLKRLLTVFSSLIGAIFFGFFTLSIGQLCLKFLHTGEHSTLWKIPYSAIAGGMAFVCILTTLGCLVHCFITEDNANDTEQEAINA
ncbi:TRAP transporter small permease [Marinomonas algicola]|uniref:TRAP transporter small permease n=1 Tax=Marinomonas algicola TaxID=2773454 RepID=UPI00174E8E5E|nr:TRAP transporter small permease [Marinomonas algicola]